MRTAMVYRMKRFLPSALALLLILSFVPTDMAKSIKLPKKAVSRKKFRELADAATEAIQQYRSAAQINSETLKAGRGAFTEKDGTREERIERTRYSALDFGRVYLSHYFEDEGADFHPALDKIACGTYTPEDLDHWREEFGIEIHVGDPNLNAAAVMIPRGFAKSTIVNLLDSLRRICHGLDPYGIVSGDTYEQCSAQLEDIKEELECNEKIIADFGNLKPDRSKQWRDAELVQRKDGTVVWKEGRIITTTGIKWEAVSIEGKMRGRRHGMQRPTIWTGDDVDNDENVRTKEQRDKRWNRIISAVMPAMDPKRGRVRIIGTNIHHDCVIARAQRKTDSEGNRLFTSIKFPAMRRAEAKEQGAVQDTEAPGQYWISHWPSRFPVSKLLSLRRLLTAGPFGAEYLNDPRDPETQLFDLDKFTYYDLSELDSKTDLVEILYVDPSKGKKGKGRKQSDFSGCSRIKHDRTTRVTYLIDAFRKRLSPTAAKAFIVSWYRAVLQENPNAEVWVEENSFGSILGENFQDELRAQGIDRIVHTLNHSIEKPARIDRHSVRVMGGGFRFPRRFENEERRPEWFSEYTDYTSTPGAFDDTIDANESADSIADIRVDAACAGVDPEGGTSRDRLQQAREDRWTARLMGMREA